MPRDFRRRSRSRVRLARAGSVQTVNALESAAYFATVYAGKRDIRRNFRWDVGEAWSNATASAMRSSARRIGAF